MANWAKVLGEKQQPHWNYWFFKMNMPEGTRQRNNPGQQHTSGQQQGSEPTSAKGQEVENRLSCGSSFAGLKSD
jgi:hypothetical protein